MRKPRLFWTVFAAWLALDLITKRLAFAGLQPPGMPREVLGEVVRLTLSFNRGAALGLSLGEWSRPVFTLIGFAMLVLLGHFYRVTQPAERLRIVVLGLITAGAVGNLIDRLRWDRGVVDFIDIGLGTTRFWTFNVADSGITMGALVLAFILGREERAKPSHAPAPGAAASAAGPSDSRRGRRRS